VAALAAGCSTFLTNDRDLPNIPGPPCFATIFLCKVILQSYQVPATTSGIDPMRRHKWTISSLIAFSVHDR
jgi:hypothetical protein